MQFPNKKYNIIYADPPWQYEFPEPWGNAQDHYDVMSLEKIKSLPVKDITADPCILLIWVTFPKLLEGLEVVKSWGFIYRTVAFTWIKTNKNNDKFFIGMGKYTRANAEVCLIGVGNGKKTTASMVKDHSISSVILSSIRNHSQKPSVVKDKIVQLLGDIPRIELFARQKTEGWDSWGNQVGILDTPHLEQSRLF